MSIIKVNPEGENFLQAYGITEEEIHALTDKMTEFSCYRSKPVEFDSYEKELIVCLICHMDPGIMANYAEVMLGVSAKSFEGRKIPVLVKTLLDQGTAFVEAHYQTFCFMSATYAIGAQDAHKQIAAQQIHGLMDALRSATATSAKVEDEG